jgi:membrane protein implicated in regulation of membrane protease activity
MRTLERILTGIALLLMPLIGLAASAHQMESDSPATAALFAAASFVAIWELARLSWRWHKESRLHRSW